MYVYGLHIHVNLYILSVYMSRYMNAQMHQYVHTGTASWQDSWLPRGVCNLPTPTMVAVETSLAAAASSTEAAVKWLTKESRFGAFSPSLSLSLTVYIHRNTHKCRYIYMYIVYVYMYIYICMYVQLCMYCLVGFDSRIGWFYFLLVELGSRKLS